MVIFDVKSEWTVLVKTHVAQGYAKAIKISQASFIMKDT